MKKPLQLDEWVLAQTTEQSVQSLTVRCYFTENENKFKSLLSLSGGSCAHKNIFCHLNASIKKYIQIMRKNNRGQE